MSKLPTVGHLRKADPNSYELLNTTARESSGNTNPTVGQLRKADPYTFARACYDAGHRGAALDTISNYSEQFSSGQLADAARFVYSKRGEIGGDNAETITRKLIQAAKISILAERRLAVRVGVLSMPEHPGSEVTVNQRIKRSEFILQELVALWDRGEKVVEAEKASRLEELGSWLNRRLPAPSRAG